MGKERFIKEQLSPQQEALLIYRLIQVQTTVCKEDMSLLLQVNL